MSPLQVALSAFEFVLTAALSMLVIYAQHRMYVITNHDYDTIDEIKKGNVAVAVLLAAMMVGGGSIIQQGIYPVVNLVRLQFTSPAWEIEPWRLALMVAGHLLLVFIVAVFTISLGLRFWGKMSQGLKWGEQLKAGNVAVGVVLAGVVLVFSSFMSDGVLSLTKSLIPQPSMGQVEFAE